MTLVKQRARLRALDDDADLLLVDGPWYWLSVIAAWSGADRALIVTEPTVSGAHDMRRILGVADHFQIPTAVLINKADLSTAQSGAIADLCDELGVPVVGYLPYDPTVTDAMVHGEPITMHDGPVTDQLTKVWDELKVLLALD